jgi:hypothetical protein
VGKDGNEGSHKQQRMVPENQGIKYQCRSHTKYGFSQPSLSFPKGIAHTILADPSQPLFHKYLETWSVLQPVY